MGSNKLKGTIGAVIALVVIGVIVRAGHQTVEPPTLPTEPPEKRAAQPPAPQSTTVQLAVPRAPERAAAVRRPSGDVSQPRRSVPLPVPGADAAGDSDRAVTPIEAPPEDIPSLGRMALTDPDADRRREAVNLLAATEDLEAVPFLSQALSDPDAGVRLAVVESLAELDFEGDAPIELLGKALTQDPESENRLKALEVLANTGGAHATVLAQKALDDPSEEVRSLAERILRGDEGTVPNEAAD